MPRKRTRIDDGRLDTRLPELRIRRESLQRRLEDGYQRIDHALRHGDDVRAWEDFWLQLLREYEALCDDARIAT